MLFMPDLRPFAPGEIRAVSLDWGDTIIHGGTFRWDSVDYLNFRRVEKLLTDRKLRITPDFSERLTKTYRSAKSEWMNSRTDCKEVDEWKQHSEALDELVPDWRKVVSIEEVLDEFYGPMTGGLSFFSWTLPLLRELKHRGYIVGLLSQVSWPGKYCRAKFEETGMAPFIDVFSFSSEVGWFKPDRRHYDDFLVKSGVGEAKKVLHVGDHPARDIEGAAEFGFRTAMILTDGLFPEEMLASVYPDRVLTSAEQLLELLPSGDG